MSIWKDIHQRSEGLKERKEDIFLEPEHKEHKEDVDVYWVFAPPFSLNDEWEKYDEERSGNRQYHENIDDITWDVSNW